MSRGADPANARARDGRAGMMAAHAPAWTADELQRREAVLRGETVLANCARDHALVAWAAANARLVYIGRPHPRYGSGPWGNPYWFDRKGDRETVARRRARSVRLYAEEHLPSRPDLLVRLPELADGKVLACWCYPEACHGEVLLEALAAQAEKEAARG